MKLFAFPLRLAAPPVALGTILPPFAQTVGLRELVVTASRAKVASGLSCIALAFAQSAMAQAASEQPPVFFGNETIVTAGRISQRLADALRNVTVIRAEDIARSGQLTLAQVLQQFGGLEVASNGGHGSAQSVFIRGSNSAHTLVLVDGIRMGSATLGTTAFENIPVALIERIEIVPGPVSSLYGSDAIGGVIQIFTKSRRYSPQVDVTASLGSRDTKSLKGSFGTSLGDTDFTLSMGLFETDNFDATKPTISFGRHNPDKDGYRNASVSGNVVHRIDARNEVGANLMYSDGKTHFDSGPTTDNLTAQELSLFSLYSKNQITSGWQSSVRAGLSRDNSASLGGATTSRFKTEQTQATWENTFQLNVGSVIAGVEYLKQDIETTTRYEVTNRTVRSLFAGYSADFGPHRAQASVRRDDNSQFGTPTTGSIAYGYQLTPSMRLRASYGTAFHAPSFNELYFPNFGNRDLHSERSRNREIGFDYEAAGQRFSATAFDNRIDGLIVFVFNPETSSSQPENVAKARIRGVELSYTGRLFDTQLRSKITLQDPVSEPSGFQLQRRAKQHGSVLASRSFGPWRADAEFVASGQRFDSINELPASRLGGYGVVNLSLARTLSPEWSAQLRWNNVTNKKYELIQGYNTFGSNVLASLTWTPAR